MGKNQSLSSYTARTNKAGGLRADRAICDQRRDRRIMDFPPYFRIFPRLRKSAGNLCDWRERLCSTALSMRYLVQR